ncbi:MAG: SusD/RagB family nutrient-binding outer membrane lipoprotein, partial [Gemmatimonadota bacterium]|nr:SusD/RagB family nutrient-binding outer membrane lipoprotein [Gemmatimonadota bacterium]
MTRKKLAGVALLVGLVFAAGACEPLTDVNNNPNAPTDVPARFLLPQSIRVAVEQTFGAGQMLQHTGLWAQHFAQIQYPDEETGQVRPARMSGYWNGYYAGPLMDVQTVIDKGVDGAEPNEEGVGRIWKAWIYHIITDLWGDVPYSEALQGADNTTPAYDTQQAVYAGLIAELTAAGALLDNADDGFGDGDLIYGNDFNKWERFANSLRMRLAMRMSEVDPAGAQAAFVAAYNAGGFTSNADNAKLDYPGSPYQQPFYENYLGRDDNSISGAMVDTLASLNDPRLALYAEPTTYDGTYRGHYNGYADPDSSLSFYSRIGNFWRANGEATPSMIMTYSEVLFLEAEAVARGWIAGDAAASYAAAIQANMEQYDGYGAGISAADIATYLAQPAVAYTGINDIHLQKWIALWMNGSEAYANWRRTDVPTLTPGPDLLT